MDEHEKVEGLNEERQSEFHQFIGLYRNWFKPDHVQQFLDYYKFCESINATSSRRKAEDANLLEKADNAISIGYSQGQPTNELWTDHTFYDFLKYINGGLLENYNMMFPGFGRPQAISCKIQKTLPGEGYHVWHSEHAPSEPNRVLAWALFLNDVEEGGELEFLHQKTRYKPKAGDFIIWPAAFTHQHRGNPPLSNIKYIATGWYEWIDHSHLDPLPIHNP